MPARTSDDETGVATNIEEFTTFAARHGARSTSAALHLESVDGLAPLVVGQNIVGREPKADVHLNAGSVSRRHARIDVESDRVILSDLGSKNGTFAHGERIVTPVEIRDGDPIRFGEVWMIFRSGSHDASVR